MLHSLQGSGGTFAERQIWGRHFQLFAYSVVGHIDDGMK
jgi:hypothetical protein